MTEPTREDVEALRRVLDSICPEPYAVDCDLPEHKDAVAGWRALARLTAELERAERKLSCGYQDGRGKNCGECMDCLAVNAFFFKEAAEGQKARAEQLEAELERATREREKLDKAYTRELASLQRAEDALRVAREGLEAMLPGTDTMFSERAYLTNAAYHACAYIARETLAALRQEAGDA